MTPSSSATRAQATLCAMMLHECTGLGFCGLVSGFKGGVRKEPRNSACRGSTRTHLDAQLGAVCPRQRSHGAAHAAGAHS